MRRADGHQYDALAGFHASVTMHDQCRLERPAPVSLGFDFLQRRFGHAGIVLQRQRVDAVAVVALAHMHLAYETHEHGQTADPLVAVGEAGQLGADIEVGFLDAHGHGISRR